MLTGGVGDEDDSDVTTGSDTKGSGKGVFVSGILVSENETGGVENGSVLFWFVGKDEGDEFVTFIFTGAPELSACEGEAAKGSFVENGLEA